MSRLLTEEERRQCSITEVGLLSRRPDVEERLLKAQKALCDKKIEEIRSGLMTFLIESDILIMLSLKNRIRDVQRLLGVALKNKQEVKE